MATSGSTSTDIFVSEGFYYETKYIVLNYLRLPPARSHTLLMAQGDAQSERQRTSVIKEQIDEELRKLEDEIAVSSSSSGFDRHTSLVFNPTNPESSIEDCLAALGDEVANELDAHLATAVDTLLAGHLDYEKFRQTSLDLSEHTQGGWNKVLVPLVLLKALQTKGQSLSSLLPLGVRFLKENEVEYIIQQGGWEKVFGLESEEEQGVTIAEDSNDIYILSGDQHPDQLSPPSSLLCIEGNSSGQSSWQNESLPVSLATQSWAQVAAMDPEDIKSLDSNEGVALAEERSENNSSNSDIVHVEREDAELMEEAGEGGVIDDSMMSVLGTESDLAALREEFRDQTPPVPALFEVESTAPASLISLEEPVVIDTPSLSAEPSLVSLEPELPPIVPEAAAPLKEPESVPACKPQPVDTAPVPAEEEPPSLVREPPNDSTTAPEEPKVISEVAVEPELERTTVPPESKEPRHQAEPLTEELVLKTAVAPVEAPATEQPVQPPVDPEPEHASEHLDLLYGGAALALLTAILAYGFFSYRRK